MRIESVPESLAWTTTSKLPVFYINRERDVERRKLIESELKNANLSGIRIPAIEGRAIPGDLRAYFDMDGRNLTAGEMGCYASHLLALSALVAKRLPWALVLEDDALLSADFAPHTQSILANLPPNWDLVHLCRDPCRAVKAMAQLELGKTIVRYSRVPAGAVGYLMSSAGAAKFLAPKKRVWPIDTDFRRPWVFNLEVFGVTPFLIGHNDTQESAILSYGERARGRRGLSCPNREYWSGNPLHTVTGALFNVKRLGLRGWLKCWISNTQTKLRRILPKLRRILPLGAANA